MPFSLHSDLARSRDLEVWCTGLYTQKGPLSAAVCFFTHSKLSGITSKIYEYYRHTHK
jgi:hypothetical protein